jgi:hypothetical protein
MVDAVRRLAHSEPSAPTFRLSGTYGLIEQGEAVGPSWAAMVERLIDDYRYSFPSCRSSTESQADPPTWKPPTHPLSSSLGWLLDCLCSACPQRCSRLVHCAAADFLEWACVALKMSVIDCYMRNSGLYVHESCCLGNERHPLTYVGCRRFWYSPLIRYGT